MPPHPGRQTSPHDALEELIQRGAFPPPLDIRLTKSSDAPAGDTTGDASVNHLNVPGAITIHVYTGLPKQVDEKRRSRARAARLLGSTHLYVTHVKSSG
jgi:hypothetical protein